MTGHFPMSLTSTFLGYVNLILLGSYSNATNGATTSRPHARTTQLFPYHFYRHIRLLTDCLMIGVRQGIEDVSRATGLFGITYLRDFGHPRHPLVFNGYVADPTGRGVIVSRVKMFIGHIFIRFTRLLSIRLLIRTLGNFFALFGTFIVLKTDRQILLINARSRSFMVTRLR